jgi:hypothetical protein
MAKNKDNELTPKEEKFCQLCIELGNQSQAFEQSYDTSNMQKSTVYEKASRMCASDKISARMLEIRKEVASQHLKTKEELMKDLLDILNMTKFSEKEKNTAIKAIEVLNKMQGFNDPEQVEVKQDINIGFGGMENLDIDNGEDND